MSYSSEVLADSPTAYYHLDETSGTTCADSSGATGRDLTYGGSPTLGVSPLISGAGTAVTFAGGSSQYAGKTSRVPGLAPSGLTVEAWIKTSSASSTPMIVCSDNGGSARFFQFRLETTGKLTLIVFDHGANAFSATGSTVLTNGVAHHVVGTYDGLTVRVYVDGALDGSNTVNVGLSQSIAGFQLAARFNGASYANELSGTIDNVAIYTTPLSATRIAAHHSATTTYSTEVLADAPAVYYKLDESSGSVLDSSGNGVNLTVRGTPTRSVTGLVADGGTSYTVSSGNNMGITTGGSVVLAKNQASVEAWVKTTTTTFPSQIVCADDSSGQRFFQFFLTTSGKLEIIFLDSSQTAHSLISSVSVNDGNAHHIVATYDNSAIKLYIDGALDSSTSTSFLLNNDNSSLSISRRLSAGLGTNYLTGTVDEVAIYSTALSAARIAAHHTAGAGTTSAIKTIVGVSYPSNVKTVEGLAQASVKTVEGLA